MALKLDELLIKKKEPVQILDLSKCLASSQEELKKQLEKVPEFKIKLEKVQIEDIKVRSKIYSFHSTKKEMKTKSFPFSNPVPVEMKYLHLNDLCSVGIQWRMLTSTRPKNKLDEEYFSKLIELGKLQTGSREKEKKKTLAIFTRKTKTPSGIIETKFLSCRECAEEFCMAETCNVFAYDSYERATNITAEAAELSTQDGAHVDQGNGKRKRSLITRKTFAKRNGRRRIKTKIKPSSEGTVSITTKTKTTSTKFLGGNKIHKLRSSSQIFARSQIKINGCVSKQSATSTSARNSVNKSKLKQRSAKINARHKKKR